MSALSFLKFGKANAAETGGLVTLKSDAELTGLAIQDAMDRMRCAETMTGKREAWREVRTLLDVLEAN